MNKNSQFRPVVRPYVEGLTTLQVAFSIHIQSIIPYAV